MFDLIISAPGNSLRSFFYPLMKNGNIETVAVRTEEFEGIRGFYEDLTCGLSRTQTCPCSVQFDDDATNKWFTFVFPPKTMHGWTKGHVVELSRCTTSSTFKCNVVYPGATLTLSLSARLPLQPSGSMYGHTTTIQQSSSPFTCLFDTKTIRNMCKDFQESSFLAVGIQVKYIKEKEFEISFLCDNANGMMSKTIYYSSILDRRATPISFDRKQFTLAPLLLILKNVRGKALRFEFDDPNSLSVRYDHNGVCSHWRLVEK